MIKNRFFAFFYRLFAVGIVITGLALGSGLKGGPTRILSYTGQSNILCALYFVYVAIRSFFDLIKNGSAGSACYSPKLSAGILLTILFTMVIFWSILAPNIEGQKLFCPGNIILHTISPIVMIGDYILFCQKGSLKKRDAIIFALFPLVYVAESMILGFSGFVFYTKDGIEYFFPYLFMDFNVLGALAAVCILIISAVFIGTSFLLIFFNNKPFIKKLSNNSLKSEKSFKSTD